jgi:homoserine O-acetyltransferase/O-succinyltransferase
MGRFASCLLGLGLSLGLLEGAQPTSVEGDFIVRDFRFVSGETLPELKLHYRTLGQPQRDEKGVVRNAVLILHGTGGAGTQFLAPNFAGVLLGPGQLLDSGKHYIILPDNLGHGGSSRPSQGLRSGFPHYAYEDLVRLQHLLLTEGLQVDHLRLVMGTSMGGMHTWMWGEMFPGFMDGLVPLASVPTQIAGRNRMLRTMIRDSIRKDPAWKGGDYATQPPGLENALHILLLMTSAPIQWQKAAPTRDVADQWLANQIRQRMSSTDANDLLYQMDASRDYDPSVALERIQAPLLAINSADDQVNPPELGLVERLMPRVRGGRFVLLPITEETRGHGTHTWPALWQSHLAAFLEKLPQR